MNKIVFKQMHVYILHRSNKLDHDKGRPAILLKYKKTKSLVWVGTHTKDIKTKEKPFILKINNVIGYYYSSGLERIYTNSLIGKWVDFLTNNPYKLTELEQQQLISKFVSFTLEQDPYLKIQQLENENKKLKLQIQELVEWIKDLQNKNDILKVKLNKKKEKSGT